MCIFLLRFVFIVSPLFSCSCAFFKKEDIVKKKNPPFYKKKYELVDKHGRFSVYREAGRAKKNLDYIVKKQVRSLRNQKKIVEQSIAVATPGRLKQVSLLRPKISQYKVWLNAKEYFSELRIDVENRKMVLKMKSPDPRWQGIKTFPFPKGNGVFCFYSMVIECLSKTGLIEKAIKNKAGTISFHMIWDGHPYLQEQYVNLPSRLFAPATLSFEGKESQDEYRFSLEVEGQTLFYGINKEGIPIKLFWVSEGLSMVEIQ